MPRLIVSTVGTAALTNRRTQEERRLLNQYSNEPAPLKEGVDRDWLTRLLWDSENRLKTAEIAEARRLSAELNGILALWDGFIDAARQRDMHILVSTDTWLGSEAARMVHDWLKAQGILSVEIMRQNYLQTGDYESFQIGLADLAHWCSTTVQGYRDNGYQVVFNLTGGFKGVQGFMQAMAQFYADEVVYIFELSDRLMRIPRLPVVMNAEHIVEEYLDVFRKLVCYGVLPVAEVRDIPETMILVIGEEASLSSWGQVIWDQHYKEIYARGLLPPLSSRLRFTPRFEKDVEALEAGRKVRVNERVVELERHLSDTRSNLKRLDFKKLSGAPRPPSTHEIDAWADADARRIYGHFDPADGSVFILDALDKKLKK